MARDAGRRRTLARQDWIEVARRQLIASGIGSVKIETLASDLGATRGSFYWHFQGHTDLLDELLANWVEETTRPFRHVLKANHDQPLIQLLRYAQVWLSDEFNPDYDSAVREWARTSVAVADSVQRVDDERLGMLIGMFDRLGYEADEAAVRARIFYYHQVGYYALEVAQTLEERLQLFPVYFKVLTGIPVPPAEIVLMQRSAQPNDTSHQH